MPTYPAEVTDRTTDVVPDALEKLAGVSAVANPDSLSRETRAARAAKMMSSADFSIQVARMLRKRDQAIVDMVESGRLYGFEVGQLLFLPRWQFEHERPLPGLPLVVGALSADLHPLEVEGFMKTRQDALRLGGKRISPRRWLALGKDPAIVAALAREVDEW